MATSGGKTSTASASAWPFQPRPAAGDEPMRARSRREFAERGRLLGIVIDEQPGLFRAGLLDGVEGELGGAVALGDLREAGDQAAAQRDEVVEQGLFGFGAQPPDAAIARAVAPCIFLRQHRFADAAKAMHCRRLRIGERGGSALLPEGAVDGLQQVFASGEAGHRADFRVEDLSEGFRTAGLVWRRFERVGLVFGIVRCASLCGTMCISQSCFPGRKLRVRPEQDALDLENVGRIFLILQPIVN